MASAMLAMIGFLLMPLLATFKRVQENYPAALMRVQDSSILRTHSAPA